MSSQAETVHHPLFARLYLWMADRPGRKEEEAHRVRMLAGLTGRVVEVGAGSGLNFPLYPEAVQEVIAVEPEPRLRNAAARAARDGSVPVKVIDAVAGRLPVEDASCDAGVASLVLCSVSDQAKALSELYRVIRPGGELRFYEHVAAERRLGRGLQRAADATFWPRVAGGCHLAREADQAIARAGFVIEQLSRFPFTPGPPVPPIPHVLGVARRP